MCEQIMHSFAKNSAILEEIPETTLGYVYGL